MTQETHTQGPWAVSQPSGNYIDTPTGSVAALTYGASKADAHLIAAAPDLLAALEAYEMFTGSLAIAGEMTPDAWIQLDKLHHKACLALIRAKGA